MLNWLGLSDKTLPLVIAGALGGVVRWLTLRDHWTDGVISIVVGAICALYASPLVLPALTPMLGAIQIPPDSVSGLSGFLIGVGGISISSFFISIIRDRTGLLKKKASEGTDA